MLDIAMWSLAGLSVLATLFYLIVCSRISRALRSSPRAADGLPLAPADDELPSVCIVIPAHNEESVIAGVVRSALAQKYPRLKIVFALDRCTDKTQQVIEEISAGDTRVEIVEISECPPDWAGKPHALMEGVNNAAAARDADLLLFVDADTELHPDCVRASVGLLLYRNLDLLSLLSTLSSKRWYERVVQPMAVFELMRQHPLDRVNREQGATSFANGQFMLFRRASYEKLGGHERVRDAMLEDIAFARALKEDGGRWGVFIAGPMVHCRMYGSWEAFKNGWRRIFIESARRRPASLRRYARRLRVVSAIVPMCLLLIVLGAVVAVVADNKNVAAWSMWFAGSAALAMWLTAMMLAILSQRAGAESILLSPIGAWLTAGILKQAAVDLEQNRGVAWGGRVYTNLVEGKPMQSDSEENHVAADKECTLGGSCESS